MLYEVAVIKKPTKREQEEGKCEELIFGPQAICASDPQGALLALIARYGNPELAFDPNRTEVLIRPFVRSAEPVRVVGSAPAIYYGQPAVLYATTSSNVSYGTDTRAQTIS